MSEELQNQPVENVEVAVIEPVPDVCATDIANEVKEALAKSSKTVLDKVKQCLVDRGIAERVELVLKALDRRNSIQKDVNKCKPDMRSRTVDGKTHEAFSEQKWKEKGDLEEKLKKFDKALEVALSDKADYEPLRKALQ